MNEHFLIVRLAGIGDVAVASTVNERLRAEHAGARITWLCGESAAPLARLFDADEVLTVDERAVLRGNPLARMRALAGLWTRLLARRFDRVLLLHVDRRYRVLVAPLLSARVSMLSREKHGEMIPVPARWLGDEYARLLDGTAHVGPIERRYGMSDLRVRLGVVSAPSSRGVILVPGGARNVLRDDALRRWPVESYVELARLLINRGYSITLAGAESDAWVLPSFSGLPVENAIGAHDLVGTLRLMRDSALVITHDTGPMHLARLVRTPLVALFGPTIPRQVLWIDDSVTVVWGGEHLACRPCFDGREFAACARNVCLTSVTPDEVCRAALDRLSRTAATALIPDRQTPAETGLR